MLAGQFEIAPFCALHRSVDGLIVTAHHYLPDPACWSPRLGPMTARICRGSDSHSVLLAGVAEVLEGCEEGSR